MNKDNIIENNRIYADQLNKEDLSLPIPPAKRLLILTCMDARLEPLRYSGLSLGDAHIIRNAGGRASDDAIRSIIISYKLLGTRHCFVIHHTNCGMTTFTNEVMYSLLEKNLDTASLTPNGWVDNGNGYTKGSDAKYINFLTINNLEESVKNDVKRIKRHHLIPSTMEVSGFIYDVKTGLLSEVT